MSDETESSEAQNPPRGVLIACGGTGGHLFPGIAIGQELITRGHEVIFLISEKSIDSLATEKYKELRFERMPSMGMPKPWSPKFIKFVKQQMNGIKASQLLIREIDASHVLGMGGFTSTAPLMAAKKEGIDGLIHESNAIPGRANRFNARFATWALTGWDACAPHFPYGKGKVVGTPVRSALHNLPDKAIARQQLGLDPNRFTLFVMGGSQGARGINEAVTGMLDMFDPQLCQFLHIAGPSEIDDVKQAYAKSPVKAEVLPFMAEIEWAYAASDLAICRSGASSLTEMSVVGLPGILIPYPHAAEDHQNRNAEVFTEKGASLVVQQSELKSDTLAAMVAELGTNPDRLQKMSERMRMLAPNDPAGTICDLIENKAR